MPLPMNPEDEQAIQGVMTAFVDAVNHYDVKTFGQLLSEDAEFVVITGKYLNGREEIEKYHVAEWAHNVNFEDSHLAWRLMNVRFLHKEVAVAHVAAERIYREGEKRTMVVTLVLTKQGSSWLITGLQNTLRSGRQVTAGGGDSNARRLPS